jgi:hypothetical protein
MSSFGPVLLADLSNIYFKLKWKGKKVLRTKKAVSELVQFWFIKGIQIRIPGFDPWFCH